MNPGFIKCRNQIDRKQTYINPYSREAILRSLDLAEQRLECARLYGEELGPYRESIHNIQDKLEQFDLAATGGGAAPNVGINSETRTVVGETPPTFLDRYKAVRLEGMNASNQTRGKTLLLLGGLATLAYVVMK